MINKFCFCLFAFSFLIFISCQNENNQEPYQFDTGEEETEMKVSGAGESMDHFFRSRTYPSMRLETEKFLEAYTAKKIMALQKSGPTPDKWEALGPKNIGGRTLRIAFNIQNPNTIYAGSASGGLWRSFSSGTGVNAWHQIPTGFPVLGVPAIAVHPADSNIIYIGTGEVYNSNISAPGIADRTTRGSYGIGILRTTDGGITWNKILDWSYLDMRGVQDIELNPLDPETVYAATSEGLYRSYDSGNNWTLIHNLSMAVDVDIHPTDSNLVFLTHGSFYEPGSGVYRSTNAGQSFNLIPDLPSGYTGKTLLAISPSNPSVMYASVGEAFNGAGLYRSINQGQNWTFVNGEDYPKYQGWYSHDVAINPQNENTLIAVGIDTWKSTDGGTNLFIKSYWNLWNFGQVPVGGPEGPPNYVHADIHQAIYHPSNPNHLYLATDGGVFVSVDNGESFEGRNGGLQTTQFYANFSNSQTDSLVAIGGMQDNSTAVYSGDDAWYRVIGGDGMCTAIHPVFDNIMFGSWQNLNILRSEDTGVSWFTVTPSGSGSELRNFNGPFEISPSYPDIMYAGAQRLYRSENGGLSWAATTIDFVDNGNPILTIGVSPTDPDLIYVGTSDIGGQPPTVYKSNNGGIDWEWNSTLPDRYPMDIAIHPLNNDIAYIAFGGFGTDHVWKTENGGVLWTAVSAGLPDVPTNTLVINPALPDHVYVGNDLGVYFSPDGGQSWELYSEGLPDVVLVMHLSISPSNNKLRVATHGNGVFQSPLADALPTGIEDPGFQYAGLRQNYPNPFRNQTRIIWDLDISADLVLSLFDQNGRLVQVLTQGNFPQGTHHFDLEGKGLSAGTYYYRLRGNAQGEQIISQTRSLVKQ